jgi:hypothetical protein
MRTTLAAASDRREGEVAKICDMGRFLIRKAGEARVFRPS